MEAVAEGVKLWEGCLVGQFFDKRLPLHVVRAAVDRLWWTREVPEISITDNGLFLFRFKDMAARDWVSDCGPWYVAGRPNTTKWQPGMEMLNIQLTSLTIWVNFHNIPLEYWTNTCLGYIASVVGKPLHLDSHTENRSRLSFARICIEVELNCDFPKSALLNLGNDKYTTVRIEYPWVPHSCSHCRIYGHKTMHCPISKARVVMVESLVMHVGQMGHWLTNFTRNSSKSSLLTAIIQSRTRHIVESIIALPSIIFLDGPA